MEFLEASIDHNTIVCLQADLGKPFISVMLIKELAERMNRRNHGEEIKATVFIAKDGENRVHILKSMAAKSLIIRKMMKPVI